MKKLLLNNLMIVLVFAVSCTSVQSQGPYIDDVDVANITIYKSGVGGGLPFLTSTSTCSSTFGSPSSTNTYTSLMDGESYLEYIYTGGTFTFHNSALTGVEINNTNFSIVLNSTTINVGDNISSLSTPFPYSYSYRRDGGLHIGTKYGVDYLDQDIAIFYNSSNVITQIVVE